MISIQINIKVIEINNFKIISLNVVKLYIFVININESGV